VEALICTQSWLRSPSGPVDIMKTLEEIEAYEDIQERYSYLMLVGKNSKKKLHKKLDTNISFYLL
jgi:hypothetical protein